MDIKNQIIEKAKLEFSKYGYSNVKTDTIANLVGISKKTLYNYFNSKEELLVTILDNELDRIKNSVNFLINKLEDNEFDFIQILVDLWNVMSDSSSLFKKEFFEDIAKSLPEQYKKIENFRKKQMKLNFGRIHTVGVKQGFVKPNINKDVLYMIFYYSLNNIMLPEVISNLPLTTTNVLQNIFDVLLTGSLTEKGIKIYNQKIISKINE